MFKGKKIVLGITGSIAAYKSILLVRLLIKEGAEVKVVMTPSAKDFVTPLTLSTLSKNPVITDLFTEASWSNHVMLGRWADLFLIAPLSCNTLGKMANGIFDNMLLATYLSATCPVCVAPAMDEDMWHHPSTRQNLEKLRAFGNHIIPVASGELASGLVGDGRMAEPENILQFITQHIFSRRDLEGKRVLVTAGPTYEPIDPVRFIGNHSSGKMGLALCEELLRRGASVHLVKGPGTASITHPSLVETPVQTASQMFEACAAAFPESDIAIMAAAVADYTPEVVATEKIKKTGGQFSISLQKTTDILHHLGHHKKPGQLVVGFALETTNEKEHARGKLDAKKADLIVLNSLRDDGAGFGHDTNKVTLFDSQGGEWDFDKKPKQQVARDIVDRIVKMIYE